MEGNFCGNYFFENEFVCLLLLLLVPFWWFICLPLQLLHLHLLLHHHHHDDDVLFTSNMSNRKKKKKKKKKTNNNNNNNNNNSNSNSNNNNNSSSNNNNNNNNSSNTNTNTNSNTKIQHQDSTAMRTFKLATVAPKFTSILVECPAPSPHPPPATKPSKFTIVHPRKYPENDICFRNINLYPFLHIGPHSVLRPTGVQDAVSVARSDVCCYGGSFLDGHSWVFPWEFAPFQLATLPKCDVFDTHMNPSSHIHVAQQPRICPPDGRGLRGKDGGEFSYHVFFTCKKWSFLIQQGWYRMKF